MHFFGGGKRRPRVYTSGNTIDLGMVQKQYDIQGEVGLNARRHISVECIQLYNGLGISPFSHLDTAQPCSLVSILVVKVRIGVWGSDLRPLLRGQVFPWSCSDPALCGANAARVILAVCVCALVLVCERECVCVF